jgi:GNAT superfamily N-acetyltransferase
VHRRRHGRGWLVRGRPLIGRDFEIRSARREELSLLPPLLLKAARRYRVAGLTKIAAQVESDPIPIEVLEKAHEAGLVHVAAGWNKALRGFVAATERDGFLHVMELQVQPEFGRGGIGGRLLETIAAQAALGGSPGVTLACFRSVPWQMPFYARNGFSEYPREDWTPGHQRSWAAQDRFGLDMTDRTFLIRHVAPDYTIRPALASDIHSMPAIEYEAARRFAVIGMANVAAMSREDLFPQDLARRLAAEGSVWIAAHNERPVGFAAAEAADGYGFLYELDIVPGHAGNKLGWSLVNAVETWARAKGLRGLTLATFRDVPWNRPYYERMGFVEWPRAELTPQHAASWRDQSIMLDMSKRLFMIKRFDAETGDAP